MSTLNYWVAVALTAPGQLWAMPRLSFGLPRFPCPQIDKTFYVTLMLLVICPGCPFILVTPVAPLLSIVLPRWYGCQISRILRDLPYFWMPFYYISYVRHCQFAQKLPFSLNIPYFAHLSVAYPYSLVLLFVLCWCLDSNHGIAIACAVVHCCLGQLPVTNFWGRRMNGCEACVMMISPSREDYYVTLPGGGGGGRPSVTLCDRGGGVGRALRNA